MITRIIIGLLFILFAVVQYNDPDPWLWMISYAVVGGLALWDIKAQLPKQLLIVLIIVYVVATAFYIPLMLDWVADGMPSIVGEMKATSPHIEWMREFLGLVMCLAALIWLYRSKPIHRAE